MLIMLVLVLISSCSENNHNLDEASNNEVIFEDLSLKTNISPNFYDNHFYLIERLGKNNERSEVIDIVVQNGFEKSEIIENDIKKLYLNTSEIIIYSLQINGLDEQIIIYKYDDLYQVSLASFYEIKEGVKQFKLTTIDQVPLYSIKVDKENRMGDFVLNADSPMNEFSKQVYEKQKIVLGNSFTRDETCCRNESSWSNCMDCTVTACGTSWVCVAALVIAGPETLAGFAVSCIGAGPNTFC